MSIPLAVTCCVVLGVALALLMTERGRALTATTWRLVRMNGWRRFLNGETLHGYVYARWPRLYVAAGRTLEPVLFRFAAAKRYLADTYHGKVLPTDLAKRLISIRQPIEVRDMEQVVPYPMARDIILSAPLDLAVIDCPCRQSSPHPCEPIQVCMVVGKPYVDFTLAHHPASSRRLTTAEALQLLEDEHARGHVHTAYFKESAAGRFYAICNCCKCCCGGIDAMVRWGVPMVTSSGYLAEMTPGQCVACGRCVPSCSFGALSLNGRGLEIDTERCMGCGVCVGQCPREALRLVRAPEKGLPLDVRALSGRPAPAVLPEVSGE